MEENIRALQSGGSCLDVSDGDWSIFPDMRLHPKIKYMSLKVADIPTWADLTSKFIDQYKYYAETPLTLLELSTKEMTEGQSFEAYAAKWDYYLHLLAHTSSFSNLIDAGKKLDLGIKLRKIEGPAERRGSPRRMLLLRHHQRIHTLPPMQYQQQYPALPISYSAPQAYPPLRAPQPYNPNYAPTSHWAYPNRPLALGAPPLAQRAPTLQPRQEGQAKPLQYPPLLVPQSQVYCQLLAAKEIRPVAPHPQFNPANQDHNLRCEYHMGAPGHTTNNCYTLRGKLQEMIEKNQLSFNEVKPPNV
ncbi:hypothetical protein CRG98_002948 [Punica granatum]|uniref:Retrotransposon gag domain-containing protein n=1 Tax=Punica granatum TaxID=22663 RepID=A0A2I0L7F2_PUNGR|nr:hypothetical protein CRG98_002948 [Punica granatum]